MAALAPRAVGNRWSVCDVFASHRRPLFLEVIPGRYDHHSFGFVGRSDLDNRDSVSCFAALPAMRRKLRLGSPLRQSIHAEMCALRIASGSRSGKSELLNTILADLTPADRPSTTRHLPENAGGLDSLCPVPAPVSGCRPNYRDMTNNHLKV